MIAPYAMHAKTFPPFNASLLTQCFVWCNKDTFYVLCDSCQEQSNNCEFMNDRLSRSSRCCNNHIDLCDRMNWLAAWKS